MNGTADDAILSGEKDGAREARPDRWQGERWFASVRRSSAISIASPLRPAWKASSVFQAGPKASRIDAAWSIQIELPRGTVIALNEQTTD